MHEGVDCFHEYAETCLKDFPQNVVKILTTSLKRHMETRCDNPKDKKEFIDFVHCFCPKRRRCHHCMSVVTNTPR